MTQSLHDDMTVIDGLQIAKWGRDTFDDMLRAGLTTVNCTCSVWEDVAGTMANIAAFRRMFDVHSEVIRPVRHVEDIVAAKSEGRVGIILGFQNTSAIERDAKYVGIFKDLGVGVIQMTYNTQNAVGSGCYERRDSGLTDFGREVLAEMNRVGVVADLSHVGPRTSHDIVEASEKPVVYSHVAPSALKEHPRTKSDDEMRLVADTGGLVGVPVLPAFLRAGNNATIDDYVEAIEYVVNVCGEEHVAIGTDFTQGHDHDFLAWLMRDKGTGRVVTDASLTELMEPVLPRGVQTIAELPNVTATMQRRGWPEHRIRQVMGGNWLRVFADVWGEAGIPSTDDSRAKATDGGVET